jgi:uncharacterized protein YjbI with pentapeptide repeats
MIKNISIRNVAALIMKIIQCETGDDVCVDADVLAGASFVGLNLHRVILDGEDLQGANFSRVELRSACLDDPNFSGQKLAAHDFL